MYCTYWLLLLFVVWQHSAFSSIKIKVVTFFAGALFTNGYFGLTIQSCIEQKLNCYIMSGGVDSARSDQLRKVFLKALDVTVESVRPSDIQECFGPIRESIGHSMDGEVVKQLGKMKMNIEACSLCTQMTCKILTYFFRQIFRDAVKSTTLFALYLPTKVVNRPGLYLQPILLQCVLIWRANLLSSAPTR